MSQITLNTDDLGDLVENSDKIFLSAEGESSLVELLRMQKEVEEAITLAKQKIAEAGQRISPDFKSIHGTKIVVMCRSYGSKYQIDEANIDKVPEHLYTTKVVHSAVGPAIEEWANENGGKFPLGIIEKDRPKSIAFRMKKEAIV